MIQQQAGPFAATLEREESPESLRIEKASGLIDTDDLAYVRAEAGSAGRFGPMLEAMKTEIRSFVRDFADDPARLSDWGHRYFCPEDGGYLIWDRKRPLEHRCSVCGTDYSGQPYDQAWTTFYRNEAFQTIRKAAVVHAVSGGDEWLRAIESILGFYADNYASFALHTRNRLVSTPLSEGLGAGRLMPQGLNEAILIVRCVQALCLVDGALDPAFVARVRRLFLDPARRILEPQANKIHNIPCWIDAALGSIALFEGDEELLRQALNTRGNGLGAQISRGVTKDGFWFEGSLHYHFFLLEGVISFLLLAARKGIRRRKIEAGIARMLEQPFDFAFDSGRFPNPNDGWPDIGLKTYSYVYDLGAALLGKSSRVAALAVELENEPAPRSEIPLSRPYYYADRDSLERLLFNPRVMERVEAARARAPITAHRRSSAVYQASCFAMLRDRELNVFLKYGHNGPSHAHPDKMTIEVVANGRYLSRDLSNAGYGARLCDEWHRTSPGHNTVVVDGSDHLSTERGRLLWFDDHKVATRAVDVYPGVDFERTITLTPLGFDDRFFVQSHLNHVYDWFFHVDGELATGPVPADASSGLGYDVGGYKHLRNIRRLGPASGISLAWRFGGGVARCRLDCRNAVAYLADSPDNPVNGTRSTLVLRTLGENADFNVSWTLREDQNLAN